MTSMKDVYRTPEMVARYRWMAAQGLTSPETFCLSLVPASNRGSVLDIGIGGGRTTGPLSEMFGGYVGVDYSEEMVEAAKSLFPSADLRTMDARNLQFGRRFDCVMFSFNGIDSVAYADREVILQQIAGVLLAGGYFIYSTHNINYPRVASWLNRFFVKELFQAWPRIPAIVRSLINRSRKYRQQSCDDGIFAVVNDNGAEFGYLNGYVDVDREIKEVLPRNGFRVITTIGNTKQSAGYGPEDSWVYIVAQSTKV